jgi:hypothetical protein
MLTKSSGAEKTVYLKPKEKMVESGASDTNTASNASGAMTVSTPGFNPTHANDNTDVARSDLKDLRQSTVALGVSQKDGSNQIVQDWLDTGGSTDSDNNDATESDVEE